jgi:Uncharacterized protein conserved in bacteria (DUF2252)
MTTYQETMRLLPTTKTMSSHHDDVEATRTSANHRRHKNMAWLLGAMAVLVGVVVIGLQPRTTTITSTTSDMPAEVIGPVQKQNQEERMEEELSPPFPVALLGSSHKDSSSSTQPPVRAKLVLRGPRERCDWVMDRFRERDEGTAPGDLRKRYLAQSQDPNVFYRATASLFWHDFVNKAPNFTEIVLFQNDAYRYSKHELMGVKVRPRDLWTWVTGDQHLSNFGGKELFVWINRWTCGCLRIAFLFLSFKCW